ncbi:hypothetical protein GOP47_0021539 [Adiantum capillus-veneris]|uniref:SigF-like NTF2-like domain-containing protein n=1 Tax=Adiantum capillus-veneris TaxID=13818 RepID=A0A9D4Z724_ADICA|nr:hypothetical protein GOP47_0021539 [Adiantum capillus-veneris]
MLVSRPHLRQQAEALRAFSTPDMSLYYYYLNIGGNRKDVTAIYQLAEILYNYQAVQFHDIVYDESENALAVYMTVYVRPWFALYRENKFVFFTLIELEDRVNEDCKVVKLIKVQRDYLDRSPTFSIIPFAGWIYNSIWLRVIVGHMIVLISRAFRACVCIPS